MHVISTGGNTQQETERKCLGERGKLSRRGRGGLQVRRPTPCRTRTLTAGTVCDSGKDLGLPLPGSRTSAHGAGEKQRGAWGRSGAHEWAVVGWGLRARR